MADYSRVAWAGAEALTTGDQDRVRASWMGAEALTTGDQNRVRVAWSGTEILSPGDASAVRAAWFGIEVLSTEPTTFVEGDEEVWLEPNRATVVNVGTGLTRLRFDSRWLVVWSAEGESVLLADEGVPGDLPPNDARTLPTLPREIEVGPRDELYVGATGPATVIVEARATAGVGRQRPFRGIPRPSRGPL